MFRKLRIGILLLVLLIVTLNTVTDAIYSTRWDSPLVVALYPIAGDQSEVTAKHISSLVPADFEPLQKFFKEEAAEYGIKVDSPVLFTIAAILDETPPPPPRDAGALTAMAWSLHFRAWAWWVPPKPPGPTPRVRLFLTYFDPTNILVLDHSTALQKGLIGTVQLFADEKMTGSNHAVLAHELLHTVGATDKYDPATGLPRAPDGFAEPERKPLYPQRFAELMGGRIPLAVNEAKIPETLDEVLIGPSTAREIGWLKD